jgi:hypothetical protein
VLKLGSCARGVAELWLRDSFLSALAAARAKIRHVRQVQPGWGELYMVASLLRIAHLLVA